MRISQIANYGVKQNFKGIIAPGGGDKLKNSVFNVNKSGKGDTMLDEVKAYDEITDKKGFDVILLEHGTTRAFIIDKEGKRETYKLLTSDEPGNFTRRLKESICLIKGEENMAVASEILKDDTAAQRLGSGLQIALQNLIDTSRSSKISNWREEIDKV